VSIVILCGWLCTVIVDIHLLIIHIQLVCPIDSFCYSVLLLLLEVLLCYFCVIVISLLSDVIDVDWYYVIIVIVIIVIICIALCILHIAFGDVCIDFVNKHGDVLLLLPCWCRYCCWYFLHLLWCCYYMWHYCDIMIFIVIMRFLNDIVVDDCWHCCVEH